MDSAKLNQFLAALRPELANVDWAALARRVLVENPQTAMRELPGRLQSATDLLMQYNPGGLVPNQPPTPPEVQERLLGMAMDKGMAFAPMGITAYHGSPYLFRQLDPSKTGENMGRQAYGIGAGYTSEARKIAEAYKSKEIPLGNLAKAQGKQYNSIEELFNDISPSGGYLYKGDIPDEILPKFLDFDKPIKEQSKEVQSLAKKYKVDLEDFGGDLLARVGKGREGTQIMENAGIRGIRYIAQEGKSANFIPFRPEDYKVQEINDIPIEDWISRGLL